MRDEIPTCRQPHQLPEVLSPAEVAAFLDAMKSLKQRVILTVCYAAGLRVSEVVQLKPAAIDSKRMVIRVEAGKGRKDRYVMLSPRLLDILRDYWNRTHPGEWLFPGDRPGARWCMKSWESTAASSGLASSWHAEVSGTRRSGWRHCRPVGRVAPSFHASIWEAHAIQVQ
jgi:integrase